MLPENPAAQETDPNTERGGTPSLSETDELPGGEVRSREGSRE